MDADDPFPPTDRPHDKIFAIVFQDPANAAALVRSAMARDPEFAPLIPYIQWSKLRRVQASVVDAVDRQFETDLLFEAPMQLPDGTVIQVMFSPIMEHKSRVDPETAWQSLRYQVRHIDWHRAQPGRHNSWPIVITIVVYHGDQPWTAPRDLREMFALPDSLPPEHRAALRALLPGSRYLLDDLKQRPDQPSGELGQILAAFLAVEFLKHMRNCDAKTFRFQMLRLAPHLVGLFGQPNGRAFLSSLSWYAMTQSRFEPKVFKQTIRAVLPKETSDEMLTPFEPWVRKFTARYEKRVQRKYLEKGRVEGRAEGRVEGGAAFLAAALLRLLASRFGDLPDTTQARVQAASLDTLDRWFTQALTATSADDALRD